MLHSKLRDIELSDIERLLDKDPLELGFDLKLGRPDKWWNVPKSSDAYHKGIHEFLKDVTGFANQRGGDLIYGVKPGRPIEGVDVADLESLTNYLSDLCRNNIDPPLVPEIQVVPGGLSGPVVVIRVSNSWNKPHMVTYNNATIFKIRTNAGIRNMDSQTIRSLSIGSHDRSLRIERFFSAEAERLQTSPRAPLENSSGFFLGVVPVESFGQFTVDLTQVDHSTSIKVRNRPGFDGHHNLDGYLSVDTRANGAAAGYAQVFRDGGVFAAWNDGYQRIPQSSVARDYVVMINEIIRFRDWLGIDVDSGVAVTIGYFGKRGVEVAMMDNFGKHRKVASDLAVMPTVVGALTSKETFIPLFRFLAQSFHAPDISQEELSILGGIAQ